MGNRSSPWCAAIFRGGDAGSDHAVVDSQRAQVPLQIAELGLLELPGVAHATVGVGEERAQRRVAAVVEIRRRPADEAQRRRVEAPS
jgi:hypothetical protein